MMQIWYLNVVEQEKREMEQRISADKQEIEKLQERYATLTNSVKSKQQELNTNHEQVFFVDCLSVLLKLM